MSLPAAQIDPHAAGPERLRTVEEERGSLRRELDTDLLRVERDPRDITAWRSIAFKRTRLGMYHDASTAFDHVVELDPEADDIVWYVMAVAATRSGNYEQALGAFERLTQRHPDQPVEWIFKSMALRNLGRPEQAEAALRQAAELDVNPKNVVAIGFALGLLERYDEALALDEEAIRQNPANPYAFANKGSHLAKKALLEGEDGALVDEADEAFKRAVELAPADPTIRRNYGVMLGEVGRYDAARVQLEEAHATRPGDVATLRSLGFVFTKLGEHERALEADTQAVELAPHHAVAWRSKGVDLLNLDRPEEALYAFEEATRLARERSEMWQAKGSALWRLGQYKEAVETFEHVVTMCDPSSTEAWLGLGAARGALGQHDLALADLRKAVGPGANRPELWATLGQTYKQLGNARAAEQAFRRGFDLEHSMVMASGVIDALADQNREGDALQFLTREAIDDRDDALVSYWRGVLLTRLDREGEAIAEFAVASREWRKAGVQDARASAVARAVEAAGRERQGAVSWSEHWFGRGASTTTRVLGVLLLCALVAALVLPLAGPDALSSLDYGAAWAALTLPITVLVLLLVLPTVQTIKAGGGSFEVTTIVLADRDPLALALPSEIRIDKIPDLPAPDASDALTYVTDIIGSFLDMGTETDGRVGAAPRQGATR